VALCIALVSVAAGTLVLGLVLTGGAPRSTPGLHDAGPVTAWMVPLARMALDLATFATLGCLVVTGWLMPSRDGQLSVGSRRLARLTGRWSLAWSASAVCLTVAGTAQLVGRGILEVLTSPALYPLAYETPQNRALLLIAVLGAVMAFLAPRARRVGQPRSALVAAALGVVPLLIAGHAATASSHYVAAQSLVVHVLGASLWAGGLLVIVVHVRSDRAALASALPGFSRLAVGCFAAVALSGLLGSWVRLGTSWETWHTTYGALVAAKGAALVVLGLLGAAHRRWTLSRLAAGAPHAFARLAAVEVLVMAAAAALAVVLARTAPPVDALNRATPPHANTFPTVDRTLEPVGLGHLVTGGRPDVVVWSVVVAALVAYLLGVRLLRRHGRHWPARRTACFVSALVVGTWALCGGLGSYSAALLSAQVAQLLFMALVVPALLTYGLPLTLVATATSTGPGTQEPHPWAARWSNPVNGLTVLVLVLAAALMTPLLELSLRNAALHTALAVAVMIAGWLFLWPVLGVDTDPEVSGDSSDARLLLGVLAVLLMVQAGHLWTSTSLFASDWFTALDWSWADVHTDQRRAGLVAVGFALAVVAALPWVARRPSPAFPQDREVP
jgi:putative copper resistance protein D